MADLTIEGVSLTASMCRFKDWKDLAGMMETCFPELTAEQLSYQVRTKAWSSCFFRLDGVPVAYWMHNNAKGPKIAWLEQIGVHPRWRGKGIGFYICYDYVNFASWIGSEQARASVLKENKGSLHVFSLIGFQPRKDKTDNRVMMIMPLDTKIGENYPPAQNFPLSEKNKKLFLYPKKNSYFENIITRMVYFVLVSCRGINR